MVEFVFPSQRHGWINGVRGTVSGIRSWGGSAEAGKDGGKPKVEIWVTNHRGKEVQIPVEFPASEGQRVTVLWGNILGNDNGAYLYWENHDAATHGVFQRFAEANFLLTRNEVGLGVFLFAVLWALFVLFSRHRNFGGALFGGDIVFLLSVLLGWAPGVGVWLLVGPSRRARLADLENALKTLSGRDQIAFEG